MRNQRIAIVFSWSICSAFCAGTLIYLGANTQPYQAKWPLAALVGAAMGAGAAIVLMRLWGERRGILFLGIAFAFLQAIASGKFLWGLK